MSYLYHRQLDILPPDKINEGVSIVGAGSIGSFTALSLAKIGVKRFELLDPDTIEPHNLANQFFSKEYLGEPKVEATKDNILRHTPYQENEVQVYTRQEKFTTDEMLRFPIIIVCPDNMECRRDTFSYFTDDYSTIYYIEGRMGGELFHVFSLTKDKMDEIETYEDKFLSHGDLELPCTARTISYNVLAISSVIGSLVKKFFMGESLPFHITMDMKSFYFGVEQ